MNNPILQLGDPDSWEDADTANPDVFWDTPNNRWVMNYSGYDGATWRTGLAYSTDLLTWTKEPTNPIFGPEDFNPFDDTYITANGSIVYKNGIYYFYFQYRTTPDIYCATSEDLLNWTMANGGDAVLLNTTDHWDSRSVADPAAKLMDDGTIELFYRGAQTGTGLIAIGRATSTDGIHFMKRGRLFGSLDDAPSNLGEPYPLRLDSVTYLLYFDSAIVGNVRFINRGYTTNGGQSFATQIKELDAGAEGEWDDFAVFDSCVVHHNGTLYLFYAGGDQSGGSEGLNAQIGVATVPFA